MGNVFYCECAAEGCEEEFIAEAPDERAAKQAAKQMGWSFVPQPKGTPSYWLCQYHSGAKVERVRTTAGASTKIKGLDQDKKGLFANAWRDFGDHSWAMVTEFEFYPEERKYRFDWCIPTLFVAVEVDGGQFAPGGGSHNSDGHRERHNIATALGWSLFHFSPQQLEADPQGCVTLVLEAIYRKQGSFAN